VFEEYRGIPWEARLLVYLSFCPGLAVVFIYTGLPYFLPEVQGLVIFWTKVTITVMGVTVVAMAIPLGILADRYGRRRMKRRFLRARPSRRVSRLPRRLAEGPTHALQRA